MQRIVLSIFLAMIVNVDSGCMKGQGRMSAIASDFEVKKGNAGTKIVFYGVNKPLSSYNIDELPVGACIVCSDSDIFNKYIGYHLSDIDNPAEYTGWTFFSSRDLTGTAVEVFRVTTEGRVKSFSGKMYTAILEVGDKGKEIRVRPRDAAKGGMP